MSLKSSLTNDFCQGSRCEHMLAGAKLGLIRLMSSNLDSLLNSCFEDKPKGRFATPVSP